MASEPTQLRRSRPAMLQTCSPLQSQLVIVPSSTASNSPITPSSGHTSPTLSTETIGTSMTADSSVLESPEPLEPSPGRGLDEIFPPFQLPEPITTPMSSSSTLSARTSSTSLKQGVLRSPTPAMSEVVKSTSLIRRTSNSMRKAINGLPRPRRHSSTNARSRDGSVAGLVRRRGSTSNQNQSEHNSPFYPDSDDDCAVEKDEGGLYIGLDGASRELSPLRSSSSQDGSSSSSSTITAAPVPLALRQGTPLNKVTKKKTLKKINMVLDPDSAKIWWDKNRPSKSIYIDDIREIRTAEDIRQYRLDFGLPESVEPRFFSIIHAPPGESRTKVLHFVADSPEGFQAWTEALDAISKHRQEFATNLMTFNDKAIRAYWHTEMARQFEDKPHSPEEEYIDFAGVERVCRTLHIHVSALQLRRALDSVKKRITSSADDLPSGQGGADRFDLAEFLEFVRVMKVRSDVHAVFRRQEMADVERGMTKDEFLQFLRHVQCENVDEDLELWESVFAQFARRVKPKDADKQANGGEEVLAVSEVGLASFFTSTYNVVIAREPKDYKLDRPVCEYYISSSHNTYLLGRQVAGVSSVEGYISALMQCCRCVEVDCWDGPDDQPVVMHGRTWTTRISFLEVIKAIKKYAFAKSRFPLWISLEVRCNLATQANMAKIMIEVFGEKLVRAPLDPSATVLPSPSDLEGRILIKVKQSQLPEESPRNGEWFPRKRGNSQPSPYQRAVTLDNTSVPPLPASPLLSPTPHSRSTVQYHTITEGEVHEIPSSSPSECESECEKDSAGAKRINSRINPVLGDLGVYCVGIPFEGFDSPDAKRFNHIFSFKERTFAEKSQPGESKRKLITHNMRFLMRVYPNGGRISSTNFDPLIYWKRGVQMAALNWQTFDTGMQINQAMFDSGTDQSGYVLKPPEGRNFPVLPPDQCVNKRPRKHVSFRIEVISAQQLMRPWNLGEKKTMDPYVEVEVLLADDKKNKSEAAVSTPAQVLKFRTGIVRENGFNPVFDGGHTFNITTKYPDLIFVRWSVKLADKGYNDRNPPFATFTAKLSSLKKGYRTIPLLDQNGDRYLFSTLFCNISKVQLTDIMVAYQEGTSKSGNLLKSIGRTVFNQSGGNPSQ
ncbi:hypothetical protein B0T24DRAFT_528409 [Lasiosphaeria ovina]|uniref:Phosphoinositide phospholipase C n=1 Tax=Lasiosphaeria ovina TaxID=92902 RepID=A0AAE0KC18_9PEZI|nr:hypothetical protein B0T24DRAFT_528409 [Lasiosphaeria ovina]